MLQFMGSQKVWHNWATELNWTERNVWIELLKVNTSCILPYCCSVTQSCLTLQPHGLQHARLSCPSSSPRVCPGSCPLHQCAIQPSHSLMPASPSALNLSQHQEFSNNSALLIRWPKYWRFSFNINSSKEYSELISFKTDWFDLLPVQGTLRSLLQHHSLKA